MAFTEKRWIASVSSAGSAAPTRPMFIFGTTAVRPAARSNTPIRGRVTRVLVMSAVKWPRSTPYAMPRSMPTVSSTGLAGPVLPVV